MTELGEVFAELGISHYLNDFIEQGFDTWETILDIKESDFDALNVKLGHRRKIQRKIANSRGLSSDTALGSPGYATSDDRLSEESKAAAGKADTRDAVSNGTQVAKRKYRRHPKPDDNAPERPPSAYVIFSNKMRLDLKGRNLSFTEIAKLVGENWQSLIPDDKEPFERHASEAKEKYAGEMAEYKKTENYRLYVEYVADFKATQARSPSANAAESSKRPRLDPHPSATSTGTASSGNDTPGSSYTDSIRGQQPGKDRPYSPQPPASKSNQGAGGSLAQFPSPKILPGYRESIYGATHPSLPWRDSSRDDAAVASQNFVQTDLSQRRFSHSGAPSLAEPHNLTSMVKQPQQPPPPLLTHESTNSTGSSSYFTPRTPMEPPLERLPSIFSQKSTGHYENQLPPLRPPSHSPQTAVSGLLHSPNSMYIPSSTPSLMSNERFLDSRGFSAGIHPTMDLPPTIASLQGYGNPILAQPETKLHNYMTSILVDDELDPVSALLKAGEIVNRNSRNHQ